MRILEFGFSNISPSPTTLEITQLELLTREKLALYSRLRGEGLADEAAVALVSGAVVSVHPDESAPSMRSERAADSALADVLEEEIVSTEQDRAREERLGLGEDGERDPFGPEEGDAGPGGSTSPGR